MSSLGREESSGRGGRGCFAFHWHAFIYSTPFTGKKAVIDHKIRRFFILQVMSCERYHWVGRGVRGAIMQLPIPRMQACPREILLPELTR